MRFLFKGIILLLIILTACLFDLGIRAYAGDINVLNVALQEIPQSMDPHMATAAGRYPIYMTYEPLIEREKGTVKLVPKLATSWKVSDDAQIFTFFLRKGVRFHDGTSFNAEAVKFNFDRICTLKKGFYWMLGPLEKYEVVDEFTVRFILKESFLPFLSGIPYFLIVSPKSVLENEVTKGDYAEKWYVDHGVGTGPYKFIKWEHGAKLIHEKNEDYWGGWEGKHVSKVVNWLIMEAGTQRMMLEKGDLDYIGIFTTDDFDKYKKDPNILTMEQDSIAPMYVRYNMVAGPTKNLKVRQAISYCFDWNLYEKMMGGRIQPSDGPCPKELLNGWRPKNIIREYNIEKAKKLLEEAGYSKGFEMSYLTAKGDEEKRILGEVWQAGLAKVGIKLNIKILTYPAIFSKLKDWGKTKDPSTAENSYGQYISPRLPDAYSYLFLAYHSTAQVLHGRNLMYYSNPKVDELVSKAVKTANEAERMKLYQEAAQIITDDCPDLFVDKLIDRAVMRKVVKGYYFDYLNVRHVPYSDLYKVAP